MSSNQPNQTQKTKFSLTSVIAPMVFTVGLVLILLIYFNISQVSRPLLLGLFITCDILASALVHVIISSRVRAINLAGQITRELKISEEKYRLLVENIPSLVWTFDSAGNPVYMSKYTEKIFNLTPSEIYQGGNVAWFSRINPADQALVKKALDDLFAGIHELDVEFQMQKKDGSLLWIRQRSSYVFERDGKKYASGLMFDNTKLKLAGDELQKRTSELEKINSTMIGREVRMAQLKKENEEFKKKLDFTSFIKGEEGI